MTAILGISALYHDAAAALVVDGRIVAAAQEERFSRRKHDPEFPRQAIEYCLAAGGLTAGDLDYVGYYEKPLVKSERLVETYLAFAPRGYASFRRAVPAALGPKSHVAKLLDGYFRPAFRKRYVYLDHHEAHAASAFFPSPFDSAAILTCDGVGEWSTTCLGVGQGNRVRLDRELRFPHSLGLLYSAFTAYCGFAVNDGEYKLMGLAPYGAPRFRDAILERLVDLKPDGSLRLDQRYFNYCTGLTMTSPALHELFGGPPRVAEATIEPRHMDLAASVQAVLEEALLRMTRQLHERTGERNLVLAGGVALNCVANGRLLREGPFERIWIQPAAGDAGGALGTALFIAYQLLDRPRPVASTAAGDALSNGDAMQGALLGPAFSDDDIAAALAEHATPHVTYDSDDALCAAVAEHLAAGEVVGWFQGRMEFGPRALGSRSILADARDSTMQSRLNQKIKFRESFRPFAPIVLREHAPEWFDVPPDFDSPYMLFTAHVHPSKQLPETERNLAGFDRLRARRSTIPAVTHVDLSSRLQTVDRQRHPLLHQLLTQFHHRTACPVLVNTSFNLRDEPIVCTPQDALRCFQNTGLDRLILGRQAVARRAESRER